MDKTVYFISGLGADERSFKFLRLPGINPQFVYWEKPGKNEPLREYCRRLALQIDVTKKVIIVGLSFGGIVAQELSKIIQVDKLIIISSVKSEREFSFQLKLVRFFRAHKIVPSRFLKWSNLLTDNYYFSVESPEESKLLKQIIKDTDRHFMKWAIGEIMKWSNPVPFNGMVHIHGCRDRIFPVGNIKNFHPVQNAGHFMIVNRAEEISQILESEISKIYADVEKN